MYIQNYKNVTIVDSILYFTQFSDYIKYEIMVFLNVIIFNIIIMQLLTSIIVQIELFKQISEHIYFIIHQ